MSYRILGMPVWLLASLGVNAVLIGVVIGLFAADMNAEHGPREGHRSRSSGTGSIERELAWRLQSAAPPEARKDIRRRFASGWNETRALRQELRESRMALLEAITAETYEADLVNERFEAVRIANTALTAHLHGVLVEEIGMLPYETRQELLKRRQRDDRRGQDHGRGPPLPPGEFNRSSSEGRP